MTKAELVEEVSRVSDLTKKHSEVIVDTVFQTIVDALHRGDKIELRGFGSFRLRRREPRKGRNPEDRRQGGRPAEARAVLQARQGTEGPDQQGGGRRTATQSDLRLGSIIDDRSILDSLVDESRSRSCMDRLFTPWRLAYVTEASRTDAGCIFCDALARHRRGAARRPSRPAQRSSFSTSIPTTTATSWSCRTATPARLARSRRRGTDRDDGARADSSSARSRTCTGRTVSTWA